MNPEGECKRRFGRHTRVSVQAIALFLSVSLCGGCYRYLNARVSVVDGVTGKPISRASVFVGYYRWPDGPFPGPFSSSALTGADGIAHVRIAANGERHVYPVWSVDAQGYGNTSDKLPSEEIEALLREGQGKETIDCVARVWPNSHP